MGRLIAIADGAFTTGDPIGDITSYSVGALIAVAAWKLFRWYRADIKTIDASYGEEMRKLRRNQTILLAHVTRLAVIIAQLGGDVPDPPQLDDV